MDASPFPGSPIVAEDVEASPSVPAPAATDVRTPSPRPLDGGRSRRALPSVGRWCIAALVAVVAGCASVDPQPFSEFSTAVGEVRTGADSALQYNAERTRAVLIDQIVRDVESGDADTINALRIGIDEESPLELPQDQTPAFLEGRWFRNGAHALNTSLLDYALLLQQLAQPDLIPRETFDQLARDLNANVDGALASLGQDPDPRAVSLFSTTAAALTRGILERQRRNALSEAIADNQAAVERIVAHARQAVRIAAVELAENYRSNAQTALVAIATRPDANAVRDMIRLDEEYADRLELLRALDAAYAALPRAHRDLSTAVGQPGLDLRSIHALHVEGRRLHQLHAELTAAGDRDD